MIHESDVQRQRQERDCKAELQEVLDAVDELRDRLVATLEGIPPDADPDDAEPDQSEPPAWTFFWMFVYFVGVFALAVGASLVATDGWVL